MHRYESPLAIAQKNVIPLAHRSRTFIYNANIEFLALPVTLELALKRKGIVTIGDLCRYRLSTILVIPRVGIKSLTIIVARLRTIGIELDF